MVLYSRSSSAELAPWKWTARDVSTQVDKPFETIECWPNHSNWVGWIHIQLILPCNCQITNLYSPNPSASQKQRFSYMFFYPLNLALLQAHSSIWSINICWINWNRIWNRLLKLKGICCFTVRIAILLYPKFRVSWKEERERSFPM